MSQKSFSLFPKLPNEIQDFIWDQAVRPVPGTGHAHTFFFRMSRDADVTAADEPRCPVRFGPHGTIEPGARIAVSTEANDSVYLTDSGLWMACRGSRAAMERYFRKNEWWSDTVGSQQPRRLALKGNYFGHLDVAHTASYSTRDGKIGMNETNSMQRKNDESGADGLDPMDDTNSTDSSDAMDEGVSHITIRPAEDLVILKHPGLSDVDWFHLYAWNSVPLLEIGNGRGVAGVPCFLGPHFGFDYEPLWLDVLKWRALRRNIPITADSDSIVDMVDVFHVGSEQTMWFIDHRLRRREKTRGAAEEWSNVESRSDGSISSHKRNVSGHAVTKRRTFRSVSRLYTEVRQEDLEEWIVEDDIEDAGTVFDFFDTLTELYGDRLEMEETGRMRLLACEEV
jgi:hypothetical protein